MMSIHTSGCLCVCSVEATLFQLLLIWLRKLPPIPCSTGKRARARILEGDLVCTAPRLLSSEEWKYQHAQDPSTGLSGNKVRPRYIHLLLYRR